MKELAVWVVEGSHNGRDWVPVDSAAHRWHALQLRRDAMECDGQPHYKKMRVRKYVPYERHACL